jgi:hypothetical protein
MADYSIAAKVKPFQGPNLADIYSAAQGIQLNRMKMAEAQTASGERAALRQLMASGIDPTSPEGLNRLRAISPSLALSYEKTGLELARERRMGEREAAEMSERTALRQLMASGIDPTSPEGLRQLRAISPALALSYEKTGLEISKERRMGEKEAAEVGAKRMEFYRNLLPAVRTPEQYSAWRAEAIKAMPGTAGVIPEQYTPETVESLMLQADKALENHYTMQTAGETSRLIRTPKYGGGAGTVVPGTELTVPEKPTALAGPGGLPVLVSPRSGTFRMATENAPAAPAVPVEPEAAPMAPAAPAAAAAPARPSQTTDLNVIAPAIRGAEGTEKNPLSTAVGPFQFIDGTFVRMFKKTFPDAAQGMSREQILAQRGARLPDGRQVEEVMGPAYAAQNAQMLARSGFTPNGANVYLAHFLGAGSAIDVLEADPNTPLEKLFVDKVFAANPYLRGMTAGQLQQWAANTVDRRGGTIGVAGGALPAFAQPGVQEGAVTTGGYTPSPINAFAAAAPVVNALAQPTAPLLAPPSAMTAAPAAAPSPSTFAGARMAQSQREIEEAGAKTTATETAKAETARRETAKTELPKIDQTIAELERISQRGGLIDQSTGSGIGALADTAAGFFGIPTQGAAAGARLAPIADMVLKMVPRFEGPQSDKDTASYQAAAGQLADTTVPNAVRRAAAQELIRIMKTRRGQFAETLGAGAQTAPPTSFDEGQTATGPNGARIIFRGGQWVPMQ